MHVNLRKTYILRKFTQCKLTQTYANLCNIMVPVAILHNITLIMQTYTISVTGNVTKLEGKFFLL